MSKRLHRTPCVVVTSKYGWSANMERLMKAQAMADDSRHAYMKGRRTLEINAHHPIIKELKAKVAADPEVGPRDKTSLGFGGVFSASLATRRSFQWC